MRSDFPFAAAIAALSFAAAGAVQAAGEFDKAYIYLEQNATDGDAEVVIKAQGGNEGLSVLTVVAPDGRTLVDFKSPDSKLGIRSLKLESPEPKNDGRVQADYPQGEYSFSATSVDGDRLAAKATLSHQLPATATFVHPADGQEAVPIKGLTVQWTPVEGVKKYILVVEDDEADLELAVELPGSAASFDVPQGFLRPDAEFKLNLGTVAADGNQSFVEISFETAKAE